MQSPRPSCAPTPLPLLGEEENLTPGLSGGFSLTVQPGKYVINCPGATNQHATLAVTGKSKAASWKTNTAFTAAVSGYADYVNRNVGDLVTSTKAMCTAIDAGDLAQAQLLYPQARIYYERIEPVAEVWGTLDTQIDGRWETRSRCLPVHGVPQDRTAHVVRQHPRRGLSALQPARPARTAAAAGGLHSQLRPVTMASGRLT